MSKLWERSGQIERDNNDARALGALAYFYVGGTTAPLTVYQDAGASTPHEDPVEADGNGRWPAVFVPFCASFDVKITTAGGTLLFYPTEIPNPDPVEAAADTADPEELLATGHVHFELVDETKAGFVRLNGRTIGNAASGATERANADTVDLFTYLYNKLANAQAPVSGGRSGPGQASVDYAASKTITLPDLRGAIPLGLDTMGNSAASLLGSVTFSSGNATTPGSPGGENTHALSIAELAVHTHALTSIPSSPGSAHVHTINITDPGHAHNFASGEFTMKSGSGVAGPGSTANLNFGASLALSNTTGITAVSVPESSHTHSITGTSDPRGSGTAHNVVQRSVLGTFYIKL